MKPYDNGINRREFLRRALLGGGALLALPGLSRSGWAAGPGSAAQAAGRGGPQVDVWVFHGTHPRKLMARALATIDANGGFGRNVKKMAVKVNAAWARTPETGANTNPELLDAFLAGARAAGVRELVLPENPCARAEEAFTRSGLLAAARQHGADLYSLPAAKKVYTEQSLPHAKQLQHAMVAKDFLEADAVVNIPVAKHHGGATLSMAMKNWMGAVKDRGFWHRNDLHQCIADFSGFLKPTWTLVDATRCMMDSGPQGPADEVKIPNLLILSRDQVAADAYAATLFHDSPLKVGYLKLAGEQGLGVVDLARMKIHAVEA